MSRKGYSSIWCNLTINGATDDITDIVRMLRCAKEKYSEILDYDELEDAIDEWDEEGKSDNLENLVLHFSLFTQVSNQPFKDWLKDNMIELASKNSLSFELAYRDDVDGTDMFGVLIAKGESFTELDKDIAIKNWYFKLPNYFVDGSIDFKDLIKLNGSVSQEAVMDSIATILNKTEGISVDYSEKMKIADFLSGVFAVNNDKFEYETFCNKLAAA